MSNFNVRFPDDLYTQVKDIARRQGTSMDQYILTVLAREVGRQEMEEFFMQRIARAASREEFLHLLKKAPDVETINPDDRLDQ